MRLKPGLTSSEAYEMLSAAAKLSWDTETATSLESQLREIAQAMEVIGNLAIDDDSEPLHGENEELPEALV
jgi:Asp-tRNA(Asn)/Glu-tRNA(Gln) amidotransferase C subunit